MKIEQTPLKDSFILTPTIFNDERGSFHEAFNDILFKKVSGQKVNFVQDNQSTSSFGVLRGLHYDDKTWKLISCPHGKLYLVVLDLREKQPNYGKWESFIIGPETGTQVLIPPGFANGHYVMEDNSIFQYKLAYPGEYYDDDKQGTVFWNDKRFNIDWPTDNPILSKRDKPNK